MPSGGLLAGMWWMKDKGEGLRGEGVKVGGGGGGRAGGGGG